MADRRPKALGIGVVGCGDVARSLYLPGLQAMEPEGDVHLVGVYCRSEDARRSLKAAHPTVRTYLRIEDLLDDQEVEVVVNLTPSSQHAAITLQAIAAAKHVYSEKPLATSMDDAHRIVEASRDADVKVACAPVIMLHPEVRQACRWVHRGALGRVSTVRARGSHPGPAWDYDFLTDPTWFYKPGAGPVLDVAVYPIHVLCAMLGPVQRVSALAGISHPARTVRSGSAKGKDIEVETPDNVQMILDFGAATFATIDATWNVLSARGPRMEIYGDRGALNLYSRPEEPPFELYVADPETGVRGWLEYEPTYRGSLMPVLGETAPSDWSFVDGIRHLAQCITSGRDPLIGAELGRHVLEVMLGALESAEAGHVIGMQTTFGLPERWEDM